MIQLQVDGQVLWQAFPKQEEALSRREFEVLFGGSRGPGKTAAGIVKLILGNLDVKNPEPGSADESYINHPNYRALVLRKNVSDMGDWINKAQQIYKPLGGVLRDRPLEFRFPSGATIVISHLDDENAFEKYQGQEFARILLEEATQIPTADLYLKVMASCRSPWRDLRPQMFLTANPGGMGHGWVRDRFVVVAPSGQGYKDPATGLTRVFIPARVTDNPVYANDKQYLGILMGLPPAIRRAWLDGDWDAIAGQYFDEFRLMPNIAANEPPEAQHVVESQQVNLAPWWPRWLSCDWGYAHNAAVYKFCQGPNGKVYVYDELVLNKVTPEELGVAIARFAWEDISRDGESANMQLYLSPDAFSKRQDERTVADQIAYGIEKLLGPDSVYIAPTEDGSASDVFTRIDLQRRASLMIQRAANQRVAGWMYMRSLMRWWPLLPQDSDEKFDSAYALQLFRTDLQKYQTYVRLFDTTPEVLPKLQIFGDKCPRLIKAIPLARAQDPDRGDPNDVDKKHFDGMDEIDAARYGLFAHKFRQLRQPYEQFFASHMEKYANGPLEQLSGDSKVWMARKAEEKFKKLTEQYEKPVYFSRSSARAHRLRERN